MRTTTYAKFLCIAMCQLLIAGAAVAQDYYRDDYRDDYRRQQELDDERYELERQRDALEREKDRLAEDRRQQAQRPAPMAESCPAGFSPSEQKCSQDERRRGCKDIRLPGGLGCVRR